MKKRAVCFAAAFNLLFLMSSSLVVLADGDDLGAGLTVIPTADGTDADLAGNNRLWFNTLPGGTSSRRFILNSQSLVDQEISFEILNLLVVDGKAQIDPAGVSQIQEWVTFSPPSATLQAGGAQEVEMTIRVPESAESGQYRAYLRVGLSLAGASSPDPAAQGPTAVVKNVLAFAQDIWLGVGGSDGELLETDFEISGVQGILDATTNDKFLRVRFNNIGGTPLGIEGSVEMRSQEFTNLTIGPLSFNTSEILPGESGFVDVPLDPETIDGRWQILIRAQQGQILKTEIFEEDLTFSIASSTSDLRAWVTRLVLFLAGIILLFLSFRLIRGQKSRRPPPAVGGTPRSPSTSPEMPPSGLEAEVPVVEEGSSQLNSLSHDGQASSRARDDRGEETAGLVPASSVTVHVVGAVSSPGLYTFVMNSRVADAIEAAGGALIVADLSSINLARRLEDGEQIVVPKRQPRAATATSGVAVPEILDLNLATAEQLAALPGLSLEIAREIVAHRRRVSAFGSVDELLEVRGIGPRKLAGIRKRLRV